MPVVPVRSSALQSGPAQSRLAQSEPGRPVSRLVGPAIFRMGVLVTLVAAVCVGGILFATQAVNDLTGTVEKTGSDHRRYVEAVDDLRAASTSFATSGEAGYRNVYATARRAYERDAMRLVDDTADQNELDVAVTREQAKVAAWLDYADGRIAARGGPASFDATRFERGEALFVAARDARTDTLDALADDRASAAEAAVLRFRLTIAAALLLVGLSWLMIGRARAALLRELSEPLTALEKVVARMLKNDPEGRAQAGRGPKEVRAIARALNDFADAQLRARAVEGRIQDELHVLDSAKDDFVSNVSHELRTPLTTISGYLEMVADEFEGSLEPRHERMLEATRRNVVRLRALIDDLLALSKAESRATDLEPSDVVSMVVDAVTDVRMTAARRGITVATHLPEEPLLVVSDRAMLYRAFLNILSNAVKFSEDHSTVEVSVRRAINSVEVAVRDHGIGIPRSELDRLGTRFFRASNARSNEIAGTGLGLRIVQTIIDKHAGDVVIESEEGEGTTVFVRLRLYSERAQLPRIDDAAPVGDPV